MMEFIQAATKAINIAKGRIDKVELRLKEIEKRLDALEADLAEREAEQCSHQAAVQVDDRWYCPNCEQYINWPQEDQ